MIRTLFAAVVVALERVYSEVTHPGIIGLKDGARPPRRDHPTRLAGRA